MFNGSLGQCCKNTCPQKDKIRFSTISAREDGPLTDDAYKLRGRSEESNGCTSSHANAEPSIARHDGRGQTDDGNAECEAGACVAGDGQAVASCTANMVSGGLGDRR